MSAPEFERVLGEHPLEQADEYDYCGRCGTEYAYASAEYHAAHLAAALNAEVARWLADELADLAERATQRAYFDIAIERNLTIQRLGEWGDGDSRAAVPGHWRAEAEARAVVPVTDLLAALAPTDTTADEGQVILGQIGEHCEPGPCSACGKSASACGRAREYCCSPCSTSRFETHHTTADEGGAR